MYRLIVIVCSLAFLSSCYKGESVDLIIHNAKIHVMDEQSTVYEAIAIRDGKIVEVGAERKIMNQYSAEETIDAELKDVYPGFTDAHGHILSYARQRLSVDLVGCKSYDEMIVRIQKYQAKHKRKFIVGRGWDQSLWGEDELPNNERLNEEFPDVPVCLMRIDGHALLANEFLINKSDVFNKFHANAELYNGGHYETTEDTLKMGWEAMSTVIGKDGRMVMTNRPTGVFVDNAMNPILEMIPQFPYDEMTEQVKDIQEELLGYGITGVHEAGFNHPDLKLFEKWVEKDILKLNLYGMLLPTEKNIAFAKKNGVYTKENLLIRSFKVYGDGALGSRGAFLKLPYADQPHHHGYLTTSKKRMQEIAEVARDVGYQMNTHAIGDSANRVLIDIYQWMYDQNPDHRWRIEHAQVLDLRDLEAFANAGIFPSVQPTHAISDQRWAINRLGEERMKGAYAYKSLLEKCGMMAIGTDFPVEITDPFRTIHAAVNRKDTDNFPAGGFLPTEKISLHECIKGMTIWAAWAAFQENELGTLEEGKDATLVIFDRPVAAPMNYQPNFAHTVWIKGEKVYSVE